MKQKKPLSSYVEMLRTMIAILISLIIVFAIILLISSQPLSALGDFIFGPLTSVRRFGNVIEGMTPLMFTGLAVIILFKPGLFNLSMEGAFFIGRRCCLCGFPGTWTFRKNGTDRGHGGCGGRRRIYLLYPGHHESKDRIQ